MLGAWMITLKFWVKYVIYSALNCIFAPGDRAGPMLHGGPVSSPTLEKYVPVLWKGSKRGPGLFSLKSQGRLSAACMFTGTRIITSPNTHHMNEKQRKQVSVHKAVREVMEKHVSIWQSVPALKLQYDLFILNLKKIHGYHMILQGDLSPMKAENARLKQQLVEAIFPVISVMTVYASDAGDKGLMKLVNRKYGELEKLNSDPLLTYGLKVLEAGKRLLNVDVKAIKKPPKWHIVDYGLSLQYLQNLQSVLDDYKSALAEYASARLKKKKSKVKLEQRIRENNFILKKRIDKMMHLFRDRQETFYNAYIKSRVTAESNPSSQIEEK
jgi:hypothetical protein